MTASRPADSQDTERLLWVGAIVCAASLPHLFAVPAWIPAFLVAAIALRVITALRGWRPPGRPLRLLLAFAAFCGVLARYSLGHYLGSRIYRGDTPPLDSGN